MADNRWDLDNLTPEQDMIMFQEILENGELDHALFHMARALSSNPMNKEWLQKLDLLILSRPNLESYIDLEDGYYAKVALAGYVAYKDGNINRGFGLLTNVLYSIPESPYMVWIESWVKDLLKNPRDLNIGTLIQFIARCIYQMEQYEEQTQGNLIQNVIDLYEPLVHNEAVTSEIEEGADRFMILSMLKRRTNDIEGALEAAFKAFERKPTSNHANFIGLCYKQARDIENAAIYFEKSFELDKTNISGFLEMGDLLADEGQYEEAVAYYKRALEVEKNNDWAIPSIYFYSYLAYQDEEAKNQLYAYQKQNPENNRANYLVGYVEYLERKPYEDYIPASNEATINLLHQLLEQNIQGTIQFCLSNLETGSAINAMRLYLYNYDEKANFKVDLMESAQIPDLKPASDTGVVFWLYDEDYKQTPALPMPSLKVIEIVKQLACMTYSCKEWYEAASRLAKQLEIDDQKDLYAIMVHPPKPEFEIETDIWLMRIQYAAVFLLAHLEYQNRPSKKLFGIGFGKSKELIVPAQGIVNICEGQLDWPIIPAMVVLAHQSQLYPEHGEKIKEIFINIMKRITKEMPCFFEEAFLTNILRLPNLSETERKSFSEWKQEMEAMK